MVKIYYVTCTDANYKYANELCNVNNSDYRGDESKLTSSKKVAEEFIERMSKKYPNAKYTMHMEKVKKQSTSKE